MKLGMGLRIQVFWNIMPCRVVNGYQSTWFVNPSSHSSLTLL